MSSSMTMRIVTVVARSAMVARTGASSARAARIVAPEAH